MVKHIAAVGAVGLAVAFVVVFFIGRNATQQLTDVAPRAGMSYDELMAVGSRVASQTGATLGSSRRVVYLLACSGLSGKATLEGHAAQAGSLIKQRFLSDREAVVTVLAGAGTADSNGKLKDC